VYLDYKNKSDTINKDNWKDHKIVHNIPEQHNGKARNQGTTESYSGQHTHTEESNNYKTSITVNHITCIINGNYGIAAKKNHRNMVCFRYTTVNTLHESD